MFGGHRRAVALVDFERGEDFVAFFPVVVIGDREIAFLEHRDRFEDADEAIGVAIGKRFEKSGVYKREDGDAGGHAEGEHEDGGDGEAEIFAELAEREAKVLERRLKPEADDVAASVAEIEVVAEFAIGGVAGVLRGERGIGGFEVALFQFAVVGHFFGEVVVELFAAREEEDFVEEAKDWVWHVGLAPLALWAREFRLRYASWSCRTRVMAAMSWWN